MFSYFGNGITGTTCNKIIDLTELIRLIKNNPQTQEIQQIRNLRKEGDENYKELKRKLSYITPNCIIIKRSLAEESSFKKNFKSFSGFIYIDLDVDISQTKAYKDYFIKKYGHLVSLVCFSSSMGGISTLFKIENEITRENFDLYWQYLKDVVLAGEPVDDNSKGLGRAMFISHDPELYYNPENSLYLEVDEEKCTTQCNTGSNINTRTSTNNTSNIILNCALSFIPIKEVLKRIKTSTSIDIKNPVLDYNPIDFTSSRFPKEINDGYKHYLYPVMIHILVYLNPDLPVEYIYSYIHFVNDNFAKPPMESREFNRLFEHTYNKTQQEGYHFNLLKTKYLHFNPDSDLTGDEKRSIANKLNGKRKINSSIEKIIEAKHQLQREGKKITNMAISKITGLSRSTVVKHINTDLTDIEKEVEEINERFDSDSNFNDYMSPRFAGIAPDKRSCDGMDNYLPKMSGSPYSSKIDFNKIRERHHRKTG